MDEAINEPDARNAFEAWANLVREAPIPAAELRDMPDDILENAMRAVFYAGMGAALSIAYHYGFVALRKELVSAGDAMQNRAEDWLKDRADA